MGRRLWSDDPTLLAGVERLLADRAPTRQIQRWLEQRGIEVSRGVLDRDIASLGLADRYPRKRKAGRFLDEPPAAPERREPPGVQPVSARRISTAPPHSLHRVEVASEPTPPTRKDTPAYFQHLERAADLWQQENAPGGYYRVDLSHETAPVALVHTSDWHIGGKAVAYGQLRQDVQAVAEADGAYGITAGDLIHNHKVGRKSAVALHTTMAEPGEQWDWLTNIAHPWIVRKKLKGHLRGNHEDFDWQQAGLDLTARWCAEHGVPYWGHGGAVEVTVGNQKYYGVVRHQYPGASSLNKGNNARRVYDSFARPLEAAHLDWVYLGHLHYGHLEQADRAAGECHYLRGGSYLTYSEHADEKYGAWLTSPSNPTVILYPDRHEVLSFKGKRLDLALRVLAWERKEYGI